MAPAGAGHAGGDGGEHENTFQTFAEDENADIEHSDGRDWCWRGWDRANRRVVSPCQVIDQEHDEAASEKEELVDRAEPDGGHLGDDRRRGRLGSG